MSEIVKRRLEVAQAEFDELKAKYDAALEVKRLAHKEYGWAIREYEATALKPLFETAKEELRLAREADEAERVAEEHARAVSSKVAEWMIGAKRHIVDEHAARRAALEKAALLRVEQTLAKEAVNGNKDYYVYGYFDLEEPIFIGVGSGDDDKRHLIDSERGVSKATFDSFYLRLRKMARYRKPSIIRIEESLSEKDANEVQSYLIRTIGRRPRGPLLNKSNGGNKGRPAVTLGAGS